MKNISIILGVIVTLLLNSACNKDNLFHHCPNCKSLPEIKEPSFGYSFSEGDYQYYSPCFNPNNANQFVFIFKDNVRKTQELCIYDMSTQEKKVLTENDNLLFQPKWSSMNWIAFNTGHQIWRIKSNGDSLVAVTNSESSLYPAWSADGRELLFEHSKNAGVPYNIVRYNFNTLQADTIKDQTCNLIVCNRNNTLMALGNESRDSPNFKKSSIQAMDKWEDIGNEMSNGGNRIAGIDWGNDESTLFITRRSTGLLRYDIANSKEHQLKCSCDTRRYGYVSVSPDGNKILFEEYDAFLTGQGAGMAEENCSIHIIDANGRHDTKIEIPN